MAVIFVRAIDLIIFKTFGADCHENNLSDSSNNELQTKFCFSHSPKAQSNFTQNLNILPKCIHIHVFFIALCCVERNFLLFLDYRETSTISSTTPSMIYSPNLEQFSSNAKGKRG